MHSLRTSLLVLVGTGLLAQFSPSLANPVLQARPTQVNVSTDHGAHDQSRGDFEYDPSSMYDQKGQNGLRGFSADAPAESIDPFTGNVVLRQMDLSLPGIAGLDLRLTRIYNSKIHRNYAARITGDPQRVALGMLFDPPSMLGLGWSMHLGRLVGAVSTGPNNGLASPRYYERPDGSQHPFFQYSGEGCGNETTDICLLTKAKDNPFRNDPNQPWRLSTTDGQLLTFGHRTFDGFDLVDYVTRIEDVHGNHIDIAYHDNTIVLAGTTHTHEYLRHFIDFITDSAGRRIDFGYAVVQPGTIRLTSITANGRVYAYGYTNNSPWAPTQTFLTSAQPPEGAAWAYAYQGLDPNDGTCADNSKRWCELTRITYPTGGTIDFSYRDEVFWAHTNPMSVRAVGTRTTGGREVQPGTWNYQYNRGAQYSGADHTLIRRPDGTQEVSTFFGVAQGPYNPFGLAWKAGVLLQKRILDPNNAVLQTETFDWIASPRMSTEIWGDPWIGFDNGVFLSRLRQHTLTRGSLTWTTTHTSFNDVNDTPRCTTERASDGAERFRLNTYFIAQAPASSIRFWHLPEVQSLSSTPFSATNCDDGQTSTVPVQLDNELEVSTYNAQGLLVHSQKNGRDTDLRYTADGSLQTEITYRRNVQGSLSDGFCTVYSNFSRGVPQRTQSGAPAPACSNPTLTLQRTVDWFGEITSSSNSQGVSTGFDHDDLGRVVEIRPPGQSPIEISFPLTSGWNASRRVEQGNFWTETRWDGFGRELLTSNATGAHVRQLQDALGRKIFQSLPSFDPDSPVGDSLDYDDLGRLRLIEHPDGTTLRREYGLTAHTVRLADENGNATVQTLRSFSGPDNGWLMRIQLPGEPPPAQDQYVYTAGGHLKSVHLYGRERLIQRNFAKQPIAEFDPEGGWTYYGYDAQGNLRCRDRIDQDFCHDGNWDDDRAEVRYSLDSLGHKTAILYSDPAMTDATLTWDGDGNLRTRIDASGQHIYSYNSVNQLTAVVSTISGIVYSTGYGHDLRGFLQTLTYPSGRVLTYQRDDGNRIVSLRDTQRTYLTSVDYHPDGSARRLVYGNGVTTTLQLDDRQRPRRLSAPGVLDLEYTLDGVGNVRNLQDRIRPTGSTAFEYDVLDRLTEASGDWGLQQYTYNPAGDRLGLTEAGTTVTYGYHTSGRLLNLSAPSNPNFLNFLYDTHGNLQQRIDSGFNSMDYSFDQDNRLTRIQRVPSGGQPVSVADYVYEAEGLRRIVRRSGCGGSTIEHRDSAGALIAESTETGQMLREFIVANGKTIAELSVAALSASPSTLEFGTALPGDLETRTLTLRNRSSSSIQVAQFQLSSPFSTNIALPFSLGPGQSWDIPVQFGSSSPGIFQGTLAVCTSTGIRQTIALSGQVGQALAQAENTDFRLGNVPLGGQVTQTVQLTNPGDAPLQIAGWTSSHPALSIQPAGSLTLQPNATLQLTLTLDTSQGCGGLFQGYLQLESNSSTQLLIFVEATSVAFEASQTEVQVTPVATGQSLSLQLEFTNRASISLTPQIRLSGAPQFRLEALTSPSLAPGQSVQATVTYTPSAKLWSPFGDQATLSAVLPGCLADCDAAVHLIGNTSVRTIPGGASSPEVVFAGSTAYAASVEVRFSNQPGSAFDFFLHLAQLGSNGSWSVQNIPDPAELYDRSPDRGLVGRPDGLLTLLYRQNAAQVSISQRTSGSAWSLPCNLISARSPLLAQLPTGQPHLLTWSADQLTLTLARRDPNQPGCLAEGIDFPADGPWSNPSLIAGQDGKLYLLGAQNNQFILGTPDGSTLTEEIIQVPAPGPSATRLLQVDSQGNRHILYVPAADSAPLLYLVQVPGGQPQIQTLLPPGALLGSLSLRIDSLGGLHAAWSAQRCNRVQLYYAMKPANSEVWQTTEVSTPGYTLRGDLSMDLFADRLVAAWYGNLGSFTEVLLAGEAEVGALNPPPTPVPTPQPPDWIWQGTLLAGDTRQRLLDIEPGVAQFQILASSGTTRGSCTVQMRLQSPTGADLGPWTLTSTPQRIDQEAQPGQWIVRLQAQGSCDEQSFRIEIRFAQGVSAALSTALLLLLLLVAQRLDRLKPCRLHCRQQTEDDADPTGEGDRNRHRHR